jgi:hypothetical protein
LSALEVEKARFPPNQDERERKVKPNEVAVNSANYKESLEARAGIEPAHKGFADLSLTAWVPRQKTVVSLQSSVFSRQSSAAAFFLTTEDR